ncbi:MAG TPA: MmcQ/YjbR family DNA-binding protein [Gemmatimonadales bacterium]|nr:MmcQ/YjbR family DNA-binding protein [Gemmatimonadales bacterium]
MSTSARLPRHGARLRKVALAYPEAYEDMPWGHHAIKVKGKTFVFLGADAATFSLSTKLPSSADVALRLPFASPTEYGLGRSGWVTARFPRTARVPMEILKLWIDESYRAIAPKRLLAQMSPDGPPVGSRGTGAKRRPAPARR